MAQSPEVCAVTDRLLTSENRTLDARGVRKRAAEIGRKLVPALRLPDREEDVSIKREAYQLALANRRKPWARRYLRQGGRLW